MPKKTRQEQFNATFNAMSSLKAKRDEVVTLPKRYVLLELTFDGTSRSPLYTWDWTTMLDVTEARPIAISQAGGLADITDALTK